MKSAKFWLLSFLLLVLGILIGIQIAVSPMMRELTTDGQAPAKAPTSATVPQAAAAPSTEAVPETQAPEQSTPEDLSLDYLKQVLDNADAGQRQRLLENAELFRRFVEQEASQLSLEAAALANNVDENVDVHFLMERAADNVLREVYMNQLMQEQLPADFPTEEQIRQFYRDNPEQFTVDERIQVWQVFLQVPADASSERVSAIGKQARDLLDQIKKNKLSFARAAVEHSDHKPSRQNDGYMGLVKTAELKPAIATGLEGMKEGEVGLVHSEDGWHILKKGRTLQAEQLPFEDVSQQARRLLVNEARQQFRQAVIREARKTYAYMPDDSQIEQWRLELKTGADSNSE